MWQELIVVALVCAAAAYAAWALGPRRWRRRAADKAASMRAGGGDCGSGDCGCGSA